MTDHDVIIVGLGPTGLTLAHLLGRRGLSVLVLEREPEFYGNARAAYTDDEALRVFQTAGVADEIHAQMNVDSAVQWVTADGDTLVQFHQPQRPNWWPVVNFFYQPYLETTLADRLDDHPNVSVRRGREVVEFDQDSNSVSVTHAASSGSGYRGSAHSGQSETSTASYLVGADGGRSIVRTHLGIDMTGKRFAERWLVVDLAARPGTDPFRNLPYFDFVCSPVMPTVSCPLPGGHHRFEFNLRADDDKEEFETDDTVHRLIGQYIDVDQVTVERRLVYTFNAVVADRWRDRRVFLAGDAAHMTPQFVGQGMNAGVRDADNLSWKLTAVLRHGADPAILDTYETERRPHARAMIDFSVMNKSLVSVQNPRLATARDVGLHTALRVPGLGRWIKRAGMKPRPRLAAGHLGLPRRRWRGVEGTLPPQPTVRTYDGHVHRLDDVLGIGWAVIGFEVDPREAFGTDRSAWDQVGTTFATLYRPGSRPQQHRGRPTPSPVSVAGADDDAGAGAGADDDLLDIEDTDDLLTGWLRRSGHGPGTVLVLRPDKYVFGVSADVSLLTRTLLHQIQPSPDLSPAHLPHGVTR